MQGLKRTHDDLLQAVARQHAHLGEKPLTTFFPIQGKLSTGELMIVGRSVNGWSENAWQAVDAMDVKRRAEIAEEVFQKATATKVCPMAWIVERWSHGRKGEWEARRSAFFRLSRAVSRTLLGDSDIWPSRLIFSNLYKVAPFEGRNPSNRLCAAQQEACEAHLLAEIDAWQPKRVLMITGWDWARPFVETLHDNTESGRQEGQVEWSGTIRRPHVKHYIKIVVCVRPETVKQTPLTQKIVGAFSNLN